MINFFNQQDKETTQNAMHSKDRRETEYENWTNFLTLLEKRLTHKHFYMSTLFFPYRKQSAFSRLLPGQTSFAGFFESWQEITCTHTPLREIVWNCISTCFASWKLLFLQQLEQLKWWDDWIGVMKYLLGLSQPNALHTAELDISHWR